MIVTLAVNCQTTHDSQRARWCTAQTLVIRSSRGMHRSLVPGCCQLHCMNSALRLIDPVLTASLQEMNV